MNNLIILVGNIGSGKCHKKGTKILMADGSIKKVEDIRIGDYAMGVNSSARQVLSLSSGRDIMYKIIPTKGDSFIVNGNHILSLKRTNRGMQNKNSRFENSRFGKGNAFTKPDPLRGKLTNISVTDYIQKSLPSKDLYKLWRTECDFLERKVPIDPYFLGIWLGDGTASLIEITTSDSEISNYVHKIAKEFGLWVKVYPNKFKTCAQYRITGQRKNSNALLSTFKELNLLNNKHIPELYKINSRKIRLQLLAGLIDTDGNRGGNCLNFSNNNRKLCDDVAFLARSVGLAAYVTKRFTTCNNKLFKSYRVSISGNVSKIPCRLSRKKCSKRKQKKDVLMTGFTIKKLGIGEYYGFTLDGNQLYLMADFTVCHNSTIAKQLIKKGYLAVSRDWLRYAIREGEYIFDHSLEPIIHCLAKQMCHDLMRIGYDIVLDEVNVYPAMRQFYIRLAKEYDYKVKAWIMPKLTKKESIKRRLQDNHGNSSKATWSKVWDNFNNRFVYPSYKEGFDEIIQFEEDARKLKVKS